MGSNRRYKYHIAIINKENKLDFVTSLDNSTKTFYCEKGKPALQFSKTTADDIHFGMVVNMCPAVIVKVPNFMMLSNEELKDEGVNEDDQ